MAEKTLLVPVEVTAGRAVKRETRAFVPQGAEAEFKKALEAALQLNRFQPLPSAGVSRRNP